MSKALRQSDRVRDEALGKMNAKLATMDSLIRNFETSLSSVTSTFKSATDKVHAQGCRVEQLEMRMWEVDRLGQKLSSAAPLSGGQSMELYKKCSQRIDQLQAMLEEMLSLPSGSGATCHADAKARNRCMEPSPDPELPRPHQRCTVRWSMTAGATRGITEEPLGRQAGLGAEPMPSAAHVAAWQSDVKRRLDELDEGLQAMRVWRQDVVCRLDSSGTSREATSCRPVMTDAFSDTHSAWPLWQQAAHLRLMEGRMEALCTRMETGEQAQRDVDQRLVGIQAQIAAGFPGGTHASGSSCDGGGYSSQRGLEEATRALASSALAQEFRANLSDIDVRLRHLEEFRTQVGDVDSRLRPLEERVKWLQSVPESAAATTSERMEGLAAQIRELVVQVATCSSQHEDCRQHFGGLAEEMSALRVSQQTMDSTLVARIGSCEQAFREMRPELEAVEKDVAVARAKVDATRESCESDRRELSARFDSRLEWVANELEAMRQALASASAAASAASTTAAAAAGGVKEAVRAAQVAEGLQSRVEACENSVASIRSERQVPAVESLRAVEAEARAAASRAEGCERATAELRPELRAVEQDVASAKADVGAVRAAIDGDRERLFAALGDYQRSTSEQAGRLESHYHALQEQVSRLAAEFEELRADASISPHLKELVAMLRDLSPKVIEHEKRLTELSAQACAPSSATAASMHTPAQGAQATAGAAACIHGHVSPAAAGTEGLVERTASPSPPCRLSSTTSGSMHGAFSGTYAHGHATRISEGLSERTASPGPPGRLS